MFDDPDLRTYLARIQDELSALDYVDPVPPDGIHMTVQGVAFANTLTTPERLRELPPVTTTVASVDLVELRREHHVYR